MAKLLSYYRLCPLIDSKSLLGIAHDCEKGMVIVTLGKNIVIRYRISDQKQISSWRTRDKFSSQVLYDKKQEKYVGAFNKSFIRLWSNDDENLDKVKKIKFNQQIHNILLHNDETYIFFKDGSLYPLNEILENRKTFVPEKIIENKDIQDILYVSVDEILYFGFLLKKDNNYVIYWSIYTDSSGNNFHSMPLQRDQLDLIGYGLHVEDGLVYFLSIWNDGRIYAQPLIQEDKVIKNCGELFTVIENISAKHLVKIVDISENYIAIYGADPNEEGAMLLIYNTQFKVNQSKQNHKLYTNESKIWRIDNNILLPVGQNLVVVPFCLESEQLAALVGSHKPLPNRSDADVLFVTEFEIANWKEDVKPVKSKERRLSVSLKDKIQEYFKQGLPESLIIEQILPEILEGNDVDLLHDSLIFFTDIPEKYIAAILSFILACNKDDFSSENDASELENLPEKLQPHARISLLDKVLSRKCSDVLLLPYLRSDLTVEQAALLLKYLVYLLSEDGHLLPNINAIDSEKYILKWTSLLIDSNYQKFVLSKDRSIEMVLSECKDIILNHLEVINILKQVSPAFIKFDQEIKGKNYNVGFANTMYSVEQLDLY